jgi:hypothetical protein
MLNFFARLQFRFFCPHAMNLEQVDSTCSVQSRLSDKNRKSVLGDLAAALDSHQDCWIVLTLDLRDFEHEVNCRSAAGAHAKPGLCLRSNPPRSGLRNSPKTPIVMP